jgi:hypothetical protein
MFQYFQIANTVSKNFAIVQKYSGLHNITEMTSSSSNATVATKFAAVYKSQG